jgi:hypothetical protein
MIPVLLLFLQPNGHPEVRPFKSEPTHRYWISQNRETIIAIDWCGQALCGRIVGLRSNRSPNGSLLLDRKNDYVYLRSRPVCGINVFRNLRWNVRSGSWEGYFYDPYTGHRPAMHLSVGKYGDLVIHQEAERQPFFALTSAILIGTWHSYNGPVREDCSVLDR